MKRTHNQLRITEIFHSLQGESITTGLPTIFIRLTGCPLRCQYCDTTYAFNGGRLITIDDILKQITSFQCPYVCVTGGEPLAQPECLNLLIKLCDAGYNVSLETSGARDIAKVDPRINIIMDLKTPGSGECSQNEWSNLLHLKTNDQIKFVLCSQDDYQWACEKLKEHRLVACAQILFSPSFGQLNPTDLANWIIQDKLPVRFQIQLHKLLWNDAPGH